MNGYYLSYLNLEKIYSPPRRLLGLGLRALPSLVDYGGDAVHSVGGPALSRHTAGTGWFVSTIRKIVRQFICQALLVSLGDVDSAERNVLRVLPLSSATG